MYILYVRASIKECGEEVLFEQVCEWKAASRQEEVLRNWEHSCCCSVGILSKSHQCAFSEGRRIERFLANYSKNNWHVLKDQFGSFERKICAFERQI